MKKAAPQQNQDRNRERNAPGAGREGNFENRPGEQRDRNSGMSDQDIDVDEDEDFEDEEDMEEDEGTKGVE